MSKLLGTTKYLLYSYDIKTPLNPQQAAVANELLHQVMVCSYCDRNLPNNKLLKED